MISNNIILILKYVSVLYKSYYFIKYYFMLKMGGGGGLEMPKN